MSGIADTQLTNVAARYAALIGVKVTRAALSKDLEESPYYPSVACLTKTFAKYNIPSKAFKMEAEDLPRVPVPFLAMRKTGAGKDFVLVTAVKDDAIVYSYEGSKDIVESKEEFAKSFDGVVWLAEPGEESGEADYERNLWLEKMKAFKRWGLAGLAAFVFLLVEYLFISDDNYSKLAPVLLLKVAGCIVACLLLLYELDKNNPIVKKVCAAGNSKKINCDAVLSSKGAKILGIGLGEIGFFYFASTTLILLLPLLTFREKRLTLAIFNAATIPFVIYSLYYQGVVLKQWCKLCIATQAILLLELLCFAVIFWPRAYFHFYLYNVDFLFCIGGCVVAPIAGWYVLKPLLIKAKGYDRYYPSYLRLKYNPGVFYTELQQQARTAAGWEQIGIVTGNPEGEVVLVMVSNMYCNPCADAHAHLNKLIRQNGNVQLRSIFINSNNAADAGGKVVRHLLAMVAAGADMEPALDYWYTQKDYALLAGKYPVSASDMEGQGRALEEMKAWCDAAAIAHTPTIFVNGFMLPERYAPGDLIHII